MEPKPQTADDAVPLRVILASSQVGWGGGEVYLSTLARELRERDVDVTFIVRADSLLHQHVSDTDYPVKPLRGIGRNPLELWRLRKWLRTLGRVILHCNDSHSLTSTGIAAAGLESVDVVAMRHTMFKIRSVTKYRRLSDRIICVSNAVADECRKQGVPDRWLQVVHSGVDVPQVDPVEVQQLRESFLPTPRHQLIVAVGNLLACKGHTILVNAVAELKQQRLLTKTLIAGEGRERAALESRINELGLHDEIQLLGFRNDANTLLAAADVVAHPALEEGLCLTVAAAMMLERPIVATSSGGLADVLGIDPRMKADGPFASITPPDNHIQLAKCLREQLDSPPAPARLAAAREFALNHFTTQHVVDGTIAVYRDIQSTSE